MTDIGFTTFRDREAGAADYFALFKPRVMALAVFTALVGLFASPVAVHPFVGFCAVLFIAVGGGAAGALNMWWDADIDRVMRRTRNRPIPSGRVDGKDALALGIGLSGFAVVMLALATNVAAGAMLAFTIFFYAVVYTMWLKRSTPQNIVIGGAAGAFPPVIGWIAATGGWSIEPWLMFALVFLWTPPHFWALALFMRSDYDDAGIPMLTVTHGRRAARRRILAYTALLAAVAIGVGFSDIGGIVYLVVALVMNALFLLGALRISGRDERTAEGDGYRTERWFFRLSLLYLFVHFGALLVEAMLTAAGLGI